MVKKIKITEYNRNVIVQDAMAKLQREFCMMPEQWKSVKKIHDQFQNVLWPKSSICYYPEIGNEVAFFVFSCENIESRNYLDEFYISLWQSAYLNAIRRRLVGIIREQGEKVPIYASRIMGPGYGEVELKELQYYCEHADAKEIGVTVKEGLLYPSQSCTGKICFSNQPWEEQLSPCRNCRSAAKNCSLFCIFGDQ